MKIIPKPVAKFIKNRRLENERKFINRFMHLDLNLKSDTYDKLYEARKTLANYAASKNVAIEFSNATELLGEHDTPIIENYLGLRMNVTVKDILTNKSENRLLSTNPQGSYIYKKKKVFVTNNQKDGIQEGEKRTVGEYDDNFLKYVYRNITKMVKDLQKKNNLI